MPRPTYNTSGANGATSTGVTTTVTVGAGNNRCAYILVFNRDAGVGDVTSISCTGGTPTQIGVTETIGNGKGRIYRFLNPSVGSFSVTPTLSGTREHRVIVFVLNDVNQTTPDGTVSQVTAGGNTGLTRTVNVTDNQILLAFAMCEDGESQPTPPSFTPTGTAVQTTYEDGTEPVSSRYFSVASLTPTTGTPVTVSFAYAGGADSSAAFAFAVNYGASENGPRVSMQQTGVRIIVGPNSSNGSRITITR
jgi:hypothetical protein